MELKGADCVAHGGSDLPEFAISMLAKLENLAALAGHTSHLESSTTAANGEHHHG